MCMKDNLCESLKLTETLRLADEINSSLQNKLIIISSQFFHTIQECSGEIVKG